MTFDEILDQVITLLQRQGRVSYRALKLRFGLDDNYLEGVKNELIKARKLAIDEDGSVLVWIDQAATTAGFIQPAGRPPATQVDQNMPAASPALGRAVPVAERRQLTVMFCDLVGSTALAGQLLSTRPNAEARSRGNCERLPASPGCGSGRASATRPALCLLLSISGSPRDLTRQICKQPRLCLTHSCSSGVSPLFCPRPCGETPHPRKICRRGAVL